MKQLTIEQVVRNYIEEQGVAPSHFTTSIIKHYHDLFPDGQVTRERACEYLVSAGDSKCLEPWNINVITVFEPYYTITEDDFEIDYEASYAKYKEVGVEHYGLVIWKTKTSLPEKEGVS